jgi:hypothetical protein
VKLVSITLHTQQDNLKENVDNMRRETHTHTQQHETCKVQDVLPFPQEKHFPGRRGASFWKMGTGTGYLLGSQPKIEFLTVWKQL